MKFRQPSLINTSSCKIEFDGSALVVKTPYNPAFVESLKVTVPASERKWEPSAKAWLVAPIHGLQVQELVERHYSVYVDLPEFKQDSQHPVMELLNVRYIGATKDRGDGTEAASGWMNGGWNVIFPKKTLMDWFGQEDRPDEQKTLYAVLGIKRAATDQEIKTAYRRMAKQWHPDVCREPEAANVFTSIQQAYEMLSDDTRRAKYNAGLELEALYKQSDDIEQFENYGYRSPFRCGLILANGHNMLGRFVVSEILQWADITNAAGQTLVSSWAANADHFTESWT